MSDASPSPGDLLVAGCSSGVGDVTLTLPGDKSISHRALLLAAASDGARIEGLNRSVSVEVLVAGLRELGVAVDEAADGSIHVGSLAARRVPAAPPRVDLGSSSTAARLLLGLLAGRGVPAIVDGDASLRARPMDWVVEPLCALGARLTYLGVPGRLPVAVAQGELRGGTVRLTVGSAQARSAIQLAAVGARVRVETLHPVRSRDHTERMLRHLGLVVEEGPDATVVVGAPLGSLDGYRVPGDPSAAGCLAAAHVLGGQCGRLRLRDVCVDRARVGLLDLLVETGIEVRYQERRVVAGEEVADVIIGAAVAAPWRPWRIADAERLHALIDEVPLAAALATRANGRSSVSAAAELRFKETDRLVSTAAMLTAFGAAARVDGDGLVIDGGRPLAAGVVPSFGDHRVAMAAVALAGALPGVTRVLNGECVATSFPAFAATLCRAGHDVRAASPPAASSL